MIIKFPKSNFKYIFPYLSQDSKNALEIQDFSNPSLQMEIKHIIDILYVYSPKFTKTHDLTKKVGKDCKVLPIFTSWDDLHTASLLDKVYRRFWWLENRSFDGSEPSLRKIRLYSLYLLGKKCPLCLCIRGGRPRTYLGKDTESGIYETHRREWNRKKSGLRGFCQ